MKESNLFRPLLILSFLLISILRSHAINVEYLTFKVNGSPVVIVLAEHPIITYNYNTLHISTANRTIDLPVSSIDSSQFTETTDISVIQNQNPIINDGKIIFQFLQPGSFISVFSANGVKVSSQKVADDGQAVVDIQSLSSGTFIIKSNSQTIKVTNK